MHGDGRRILEEHGMALGKEGDGKEHVLGSEKGAGNKIIEVQNTSSTLETLI